MARTKNEATDTPAPTPSETAGPSGPVTLVASVPVHPGHGAGTARDGSTTTGWSGNPVEPGDSLTTKDAALAERLVTLGYARPA